MAVDWYPAPDLPAADESDRHLAHLWVEYMRRQLGRPSMTDDEFERLGHTGSLPPRRDQEHDPARRPDSHSPGAAEKGPPNGDR